VPVLGTALVEAKHILLDRDDKRSQVRDMGLLVGEG
jgi:hypothetical protein